MNSTLTTPVHVAAIDPVWDAVMSGARQIAAGESSLVNLVYSSILNHTKFEDALAHRLAERLHHSDVSADLIRQAFGDALELRPEIGIDVMGLPDLDTAKNGCFGAPCTETQHQRRGCGTAQPSVHND